MQVDTWARGFSYAYDAPLDMRMDPDQELTAQEIVNTWDERRLARLLREYGEERYASQIARVIGRTRRREQLSSTQQLVDVIKAAVPIPAQFAGGHPARRTFQALRIAVNDELGQLDAALPAAWELLRSGRPAGRDLVPFARGSPRQALPRGPGTRLRLPARSPDLRLRPRARGRAADPACGRADAGRGRGQPEVQVSPPARRAQARRARTCDTRSSHSRRPRSRQETPTGSARRSAPQAGAGLRRTARRASPRASAQRGLSAPQPGRPRPASGRRRPGLRTATPPAASRRARAQRAGAAPHCADARPQRAARAVGARAVQFVRTLPDHRLLDRLIRGRAWIPLLGVMLVGIVAMQVEVLKLGASIGRSIQRTSAPPDQQRDAAGDASPRSTATRGSKRSPPRRAW